MANDPDKIIISPEDLTGPDPTPPSAPYMPAPPIAAPPPLGAQPLPPAQNWQPGYRAPTQLSLAKLGANALLIGLIGGAIGGFVGALVAELVLSVEPTYPSHLEMNLFMGLWTAVIGTVLGFALTSLDGFTSGSPEKGLLDGLKGAGAGAAAGFVGGFIAQVIYRSMLENATSESSVWVARIIAWGLFGALVGLGIGLPFGPKRIVNGLLGGLTGGAAGGLVFQMLANGVRHDTIILRLVGITVTAIGIGVAIGLVERARKDSWLMVVGGPMTGKEIILYKPTTIIGSDYRSDLVLVKDPAVALQHVSLNREPSGAVSLYAAPGATVLVNGAPVQSHRLRTGDHLGIGASTLVYQQRAVAPAPAYPGSPTNY